MDSFPDMRAEENVLVHTLMTKTLKGPRAVSLRRLIMPDGKRHALVVILGEVHANPNLCDSDERDVVDVVQLILDVLMRVEPSILLVETFFHLIGKTRQEMQDILKSMEERGWPVDRVKQCAGEREEDCVYTGSSNALVFLRTLVTVLKNDAMLAPGDATKQSVASRMMEVDLREDLDLPDPFAMRETPGPDDARLIREAAARITRESLQRFELVISNAEWQAAYDERVVGPFLERARRAEASGSLDDYFYVFLQAPDIISMNRIISTVADAYFKDMVMPIIFVYAGDAHRTNLLDLMSAWGLLEIQNLGDRRAEDEMGSCIVHGPPVYWRAEDFRAR